MGFYLGSVIGIVLTLLLIRYLTAARFIMSLLAHGGIAIASLAGFFLAWPVHSQVDPVYGAAVGAIVGAIIFLRPLLASSSRSV
jgi:hypothetical protein